jgi:hypothetical protein
MITIFDICINYKFNNMLLYIDDFKLLFSNSENVERFRKILKDNLNLDVVINNDNGKMLELDMDNTMVFYYNLNTQRRHKENNKLSIPHYIDFGYWYNDNISSIQNGCHILFNDVTGGTDMCQTLPSIQSINMGACSFIGHIIFNVMRMSYSHGMICILIYIIITLFKKNVLVVLCSSL